MIPTEYKDMELVEALEIVQQKQPGRTYAMDIAGERIEGYVDGLDALKQAIYKEINTEKDVYVIYPNYGLKKQDLFGQPKKYAYMILTERISECLMKDDRILDVYDFYYLDERSKGGDLAMRFAVDSIYGQVEIQEVFRI